MKLEVKCYKCFKSSKHQKKKSAIFGAGLSHSREGKASKSSPECQAERYCLITPLQTNNTKR